MQLETPTDIDAKVHQSLQGTRFEPRSIKRLVGGSVNWVYVVELLEPLDDGTGKVLVKHGETHMASKPEFPLTLLRCRIEVDILRGLSNEHSFGRSNPSDMHQFDIRTANLHHFDERSTNQIQEFLENGIDLKEYVLRHYSSPTPESLAVQARGIGSALGKWLKGFVEWSTRQVELQQSVAENTFAQDVKHMINFLFLFDRINDFPDILNDVKDLFEQIEHMAAEERQDNSKHQIIHGDFWTGNITLPNSPIQEGKATTMFVVDWECTQLGLPSVDFGQMIAEMYALWLYKSITAGLWMMEGFVEAYGPVTEDFAFRTALLTGTHLLCTTTTFPGWGTADRIEEVACIGRDIIVHSWKRDRFWFEKGDLACLFRSVI